MEPIHTMEQYREVYRASIEDPEKFWSEIAEEFRWKRKWDKVLEWDFHLAEFSWFKNAKLNITENCLDRHLPEKKDDIAFFWEPNDPQEPGRVITYEMLYRDVCKLANGLKSLGVKKGDRVCIYMPMVPEAVVAVLACARIGAVHSVVFGGFSATALADRINDSACKVVLTSDGAFRGKKIIPIKDIVDEALKNAKSVERVVCLKRTNNPVHIKKGRDLDWLSLVAGQDTDCPAEEMDSEDPLFILYTSGSTGKPKGVVHTCGGYMVYTKYSFSLVFQYQQKMLFWCTADIGWITGHSYIVYGPLLAGAGSVIFEGIPSYPDSGRFWEVVDKYQVNIFYTAPTAIRSLQAAGLDFVQKYKLDSLKVLGSVGEPINEEAWQWYHTNIGKGRCPIVDTWWQTETGGIMISPIAGVTPEKPGFAMLPLPGVRVALLNERGEEVMGNPASGNLCITFPWPSIIRTTYGDHERCRQTYFASYNGKYFTGDGCKRDEEGYYRITGRVDDVINVSGHRIGTAEIESAINMHPDVVESAVVGFPHPLKGQGIYAFVICTRAPSDEAVFTREIIEEVGRQIGPIAKPDKVQKVKGLPKTRSGKIMRRILRKIAEGESGNFGDVSTLLDPGVVQEIVEGSK